MGLFDVFKKIFHNSTDNLLVIEQTAAQDNPPLVTITFSQEPPADSPSPDIVPLNVLLKKAVPTKRGLYPHEILMLTMHTRFLPVPGIIISRDFGIMSIR